MERGSQHDATGGGWDVHRQEITSLYLDKQFSLRSVKQWMDHKYDFGATQRQYKTRFAHWGIKKRPTKALSTQDRSGMKRKWENGALVPFSSAQISSKKQRPSPERSPPSGTFPTVLTQTQTQPPCDVASVSTTIQPVGSPHMKTQSSATGIPEALRNVDPTGTDTADRDKHASAESAVGSCLVPFRVNVTHSDGPERFSLSAEELSRNLTSLSDQLHSPSDSLRIVESSMRSWTLMSPVLMKTPSKSSSVSPVSTTPSKGLGTQSSMKTPSSSSSSQHDTSLASSRFINSADHPGQKSPPAQENTNNSALALRSSSVNSEGKSRQWLSRCFLACILSARGKAEPFEASLEAAREQYWQMAQSNDTQLLTAQIVLVSILHSHGQLDMAGTLIDQAYRILEHHFNNHSPILTVANYLKIGARQELRQSSIQPSSLASAHETLSADFGPASSHALAALYSLAFLQIVRKEYLDAESNLRKLYDLSKDTLDSYHLITIASLTARARVLTHLHRPREAIPLLVDATERDTISLGYSHPLRMDHRRRLANTYRDLGDPKHLQLVESIYREVFEARKQMLGSNHPYTRGILQTLLDFLRDRGRVSEAREMEEIFDTAKPGQGFHVEVIGSY